MNRFILILLVTAIITSCSTEKDPYLISKNSIGHLTDTTMIKDLIQIFKNDSIRNDISGDSFSGKFNDITILDKKGNELLEITPKEDLDYTSTAKLIRIIDPKYKTKKGIGSSSTFKEIRDNYNISSIQNSLRNIIISINSANLYFTIDKNQLPSNLRYNSNIEIDKAQIPDNAKINDLYLQWIN
ncbi:MAG: hypothetical protein ACKVJ4_04510 [Flavobacteriales bacterium]|jgi:hypothetical protein|tara:strand:+ start:15033 stop:15587 length:555 start_codon:yes stop_codon:yes gene_type:complete